MHSALMAMKTRQVCFLSLAFVTVFLIWFMLQVLFQEPNVSYAKRFNIQQVVKPKIIFGYTMEKDGSQSKIPHIIHQTYAQDILPVILKKWMKSWLQLNPQWQYWFWTDKDIRELISTRFPEFLAIFDSYEKNISRADVFRYFVLYEFGGLYADTDIECLKPLNESVSTHSCILSREPSLHAYFLYRQPKIIANSLMACKSRHPFFRFLIQQLVDFASFDNVIFATGPKFIDSVYDIYASSKVPISSSGNMDGIFIAHPDVYQPKIDPRRVETFRKACIKAAFPESAKMQDDDTVHLAQMCNPLISGDFKNGPKDTSVTIHHWTHMWNPKYKNDQNFGIMQKNGTFHITELFT